MVSYSRDASSNHGSERCSCRVVHMANRAVVATRSRQPNRGRHAAPLPLRSHTLSPLPRIDRRAAAASPRLLTVLPVACVVFQWHSHPRVTNASSPSISATASFPPSYIAPPATLSSPPSEHSLARYRRHSRLPICWKLHDTIDSG
jgi:hypothetical protein